MNSNVFWRPVVAAWMVLLALLLPDQVAGGEMPAPVNTSVHQALDTAISSATASETGPAPAVSIAIVENGNLEYQNASGLADIGAKRAATSATRFRIGSITKMFTAVAVMQLVEQGKMGLEDKLSRYLPKAPHADEVTIRQLLMHTSGILNYFDSALANGSTSKPASAEELVSTVAKASLDFAPGAHYEYSNTGYVLLGMVVEHVSALPLHDYVRRNILDPTQMKETSFGSAPPNVPLALGYADATGKPAQSFDMSWSYAVGDMLSTAPDLARFDIALMAGRLVRPETLALMQSHPVATGDGKAMYGLGLQVFPFGEKTVIGHHGGLPGFEADNEMIVADRCAVIVLGNSFQFQTSRVLGRVLALLFPATSSSQRAAALKAAASPADGEDPAVTALLRRFLADFQRGTVDRTVLTSAMNNALTPEALAGAAKQFGPLGELESTIFRGKIFVNGNVFYRYEGTFASQRLPMTFMLAKDGKIAGFYFK